MGTKNRQKKERPVTDVDHSIAMMTHRAHSHGRDHVFHADLVLLAEAYEHLRPVFEELQFLRQQVEDLELRIARN
jgi:hypothetical protein